MLVLVRRRVEPEQLHLRAQPADEVADVRRAAHGEHLDTISGEVAAESRRERLDGALVALSFDEDDSLHVPIVTD